MQPDELIVGIQGAVTAVLIWHSSVELLKRVGHDLILRALESSLSHLLPLSVLAVSDDMLVGLDLIGVIVLCIVDKGGLNLLRLDHLTMLEILSPGLSTPLMADLVELLVWMDHLGVSYIGTILLVAVRSRE